MALVDELETATDEEIQEAGRNIYIRFIKKLILGVAVGVAAHFISEALVDTIENRRKNQEITE